jgi:uncharacterized protein (DUF697 family)
MTAQQAEAASPDKGAAVQISDADRLERRYKAENLIKNHVMAAGAMSVVPLPLLDIAAITVVQLRMIQKLAAMYSKSFSERPVRNTIAGLAGGVLGHSAGVITALSLAKAIPGIGWALGMVTLPVVVGASSYAIGRVYLRHFEEGGSIYDISVDNAKSYYNEQLEKGKQIAEAAKAGVRKRTDPGAQTA